AQRDLLRLVDDPHAAAAYLAQHLVVAQPVQLRTVAAPNTSGTLLRDRACLFHVEQERKEAADLVGPLGIAMSVFAERRPLAAAAAFEEFLGQFLHRVAVGARFGHGSLLLRRFGSQPIGWTECSHCPNRFPAFLCTAGSTE